jgi:hypothetical protein
MTPSIEELQTGVREGMTVDVSFLEPFQMTTFENIGVCVLDPSKQLLLIPGLHLLDCGDFRFGLGHRDWRAGAKMNRRGREGMI